MPTKGYGMYPNDYAVGTGQGPPREASMAREWLDELREVLFGRVFRADSESGFLALVRPVAPFDGRGSALVAFGSLLVVIVSIAAGLASLAGLLAALAAIYLILVHVFGIRFEPPEVSGFGL